jgi:hypothetical protein
VVIPIFDLPVLKKVIPDLYWSPSWRNGLFKKGAVCTPTTLEDWYRGYSKGADTHRP